jgi:hypothetical protein
MWYRRPASPLPDSSPSDENTALPGELRHDLMFTSAKSDEISATSGFSHDSDEAVGTVGRHRPDPTGPSGVVLEEPRPAIAKAHGLT